MDFGPLPASESGRSLSPEPTLAAAVKDRRGGRGPQPDRLQDLTLNWFINPTQMANPRDTSSKRRNGGLSCDSRVSLFLTFCWR